MLSAGDGIAIASVCAVAFGAIMRFKPSTPAPPPPTNGNRPVTKDLCDARFEALQKEQSETKQALTDGLNRIWKKLDALTKQGT